MTQPAESLFERVSSGVRGVARHRAVALGTASVVAVLCALGILARPDRYEARARVYVDTQTVLKPLMVGLAFQPDVDQQVRMLAQTLISRPNVQRLVDATALQPELDVGSRDQVVTRLMNRIKLESVAAGGNVYDISYRGTTPEGAERLVAATLDMFMAAGSGSKKRDSEHAGRFIEEQISQYEATLAAAENRVKEFKRRSFGVSGVSDRDYFSRVSSLAEEVTKARTELASAERSRDAYRRELALEDPQLPADPLPRTTGPVVQAEARLTAQKKHLDELLGRYTESHPDVIGARRIIQEVEIELQEQRRAEAQAGAIAARSPRKPGAATSPVYQRLRISLAESEARVAALRTQLGALQGQLDETRALADRAPQVEAELAQLNRDYDVVRKNYDQLVARRESAALGVKLDQSAQMAEFRVVEPPRASPQPVRPARWHLALAAMVLSLAAGIGAAAWVDRLRPTFDDARALRRFSGRPLVGTVSLQASAAASRQRQLRQLSFAAAIGLLLVLQAGWVAWLAMRSTPG